MIDRTVHTIIDEEKCTGCGLCVKVCPNQTISIENGKAVVSGDRSQNCGHCAAICPEDAICVKENDHRSFSFNTFQVPNTWLPHGKFDTANLTSLMGSRRSCRNYKESVVDRKILEDLVKIGITAPSGTNSQGWCFTILPNRADVESLAGQIGLFFKRVNQKAEISILRWLLKIIGKPQLDHYFKNYYESVREALDSGKDQLFHGAAAVIVVSSKPDASCPLEDAMLATQNILLGAHSMGLGTCLIGFAVSAMENDPVVKQFINIPDEERVCSVIAMGYPDEEYRYVAYRKKVVPRYFEV